MSLNNVVSPAEVAANLSDLLLANGLANTGTWLVALSGGADSVALLHLLARSTHRSQVRACYVHHGLQTEADEWEVFCRTLCADLVIPFTAVKVKLEPRAVKQKGLEASARDARYTALFSQMNADDILLTAHHADDQLETLLFRLERGSGLLGLAGIAAVSTREERSVCRPLLNTTKSDLCSYLQAQGQRWINDPSNLNVQLRRNKYRHDYIPQLPENLCIDTLALAVLSGEVYGKLAIACSAWLKDREVLEGRKLTLRDEDFLQPTLLRHRLNYWFSNQGFSLPSTVLSELLRQASNSVALGHRPSYQTDRYQLYLKRRTFIIKGLAKPS